MSDVIDPFAIKAARESLIDHGYIPFHVGVWQTLNLALDALAERPALLARVKELEDALGSELCANPGGWPSTMRKRIAQLEATVARLQARLRAVTAAVEDVRNPVERRMLIEAIAGTEAP